MKWIGIVEAWTSGLGVDFGRDEDSVVSATPNVTVMTDRTWVKVYLVMVSYRLRRDKCVLPLPDDEISEEHANNQTSTPKDNMHRHRNLIAKCHIIQQRDHIEKGDLDEIGRQRNLTRPQSWVWDRSIAESYMLWQSVDSYQKELEEGD